MISESVSLVSWVSSVLPSLTLHTLDWVNREPERFTWTWGVTLSLSRKTPAGLSMTTRE